MTADLLLSDKNGQKKKPLNLFVFTIYIKSMIISYGFVARGGASQAYLFSLRKNVQTPLSPLSGNGVRMPRVFASAVMA